MNPEKALRDLGSKTARVSAAAMRKLIANGSNPVVRRGLLKLLTNTNYLSRGNAVIAIGQLNMKEAIPRLIQLLSDSDLRTRCFCASALGKLGDRKAIPALEQLAHDTSNAYQKKLVANAINKLAHGGKFHAETYKKP